MRHATSVLRALALACAALAGCAPHTAAIVPAAAVPAAAAMPPDAQATIPLALNSGNKPGLNLTITIGGGTARPFLLDTGSSGLWVYPNAIGSYTKTTYAVTNSYGSGIVYDGIMVRATVDFGNGLVAPNVPLALVQRASCKSTMPNCPAAPNATNCPGIKPGPNAGIACLEAGRKLYGTFGAALEPIYLPNASAPKTAMYNALFGIPQSWASRFSVTPTALKLGTATRGFTLVPMRADAAIPNPPASGAKAWKRDVTLCYTVGSAVKNYCVDSLFDTGASAIGFQTTVKLPTTQTPCGTRVKAGTPFLVRERNGGPVIGSFVAGYVVNLNAIRPDKPKKHPQVNTGLTFYNSDEILFDASAGRVGLRKLPTPAHIAQRGCYG